MADNEFCVPSNMPIPHLTPTDPVTGRSGNGDMAVASGDYCLHPDGSVTTRFKGSGGFGGGVGVDGGTA